MSFVVRELVDADWGSVEAMQETHAAGINAMRKAAGKEPVTEWSFPAITSATWYVVEREAYLEAALGWVDDYRLGKRHITLLWNPNRYGKLAAAVVADFAIYDADERGLRVWFHTHPDASEGFRRTFEARGFGLVGLEYERPIGGLDVRE